MGLQTAWGPLIAWYLFLAGAGAGAYLVSAVASFLGERYRPLVKPGIYLGAPLVAIGSLLLLLDLGAPTRAWRGFLRPQSSIISVGIIIISVFIVLGAIHLALVIFNRKPGQGTVKALSAITGLFALGTAIYTGLLLGVVKAVPFWNTPILPLLFLVSALSTGMGAVLLFIGLRRWVAPAAADKEAAELTESIHALSRLDAQLVVTELLVLFFMLFILSTSGSLAAASTQFLLSGDYKVAFWLGLVVVGLLVPFALEAWSLARKKGLNLARLSDVGLVTGFALLVGGLILRYAVLAAGANFASTL